MTEPLYEYVLDHTREPGVLAELRAETHRRNGSQMQISPEQGAFMRVLALMLGARKCIDVGVFTGYSSLSVALALPEGGTLVACDVDPATMAVAQEFWDRAGVSGRVVPRLGRAAETLRELAEDPAEAGTYDLVFLDADKRGYCEQYELALALLRPGGCVGVDNVLWYGKVADPARMDKNTEAIRALNALAVQDPRVDASLVPIGDGMMLCRKRE